MQKKDRTYKSLAIEHEWSMPDGERITRDDVVAGYIIRMSDTIQKMANDLYSIKIQIREFRAIKRQNSALRGVITKLKKRVR